MSRSTRSPLRAAREQEPYVIAAGGGLELRVNPDGTRYWTQAPREPGASNLIVGTYPDLSLRDALARRSELESELATPVAPVRIDSGTTSGTRVRAPVAVSAITALAEPARRLFLQSSLAIAGAAVLPQAAFGMADGMSDLRAGHGVEDPHLADAEAAEAESTGATDHLAGFVGRIKAWIQYPVTFGEKSYVRYSPINIVRGVINVEVRSTVALSSVVIKAMGPHGELRRSAVLHAAPYIWSLDTKGLPEGNVVIDAEVSPSVPFLHAVVVVDNDHAPVTGVQWIPVGARNTLEEFSSTAWGYEWVKYPATRTGGRLVPRLGTPFAERVKRTDLWQQAMTSTSVARHDASRQFVTLEGGHISVVERQSYTQADNFKLLVGNCIDGPYGVGRVGSMWNGYVDSKGALVGICGQGRAVRVDLEGKVETLLGPRLRPGVEPPIFPPSGTAEQWAWIETFYEYVGTITDGPPNLANPWQIVADPRNEHVLYIADSDNNRIVIYDTLTKVGRTFAGGLEGFTDGLGVTAMFNRPRGLAWSQDGETLYVADDHNSAIRTINRAGVVTTLVHSARGSNYDLVLKQGQFKKMNDFAGMIRSYLKDGKFGEANFMHPNALQLDSEGNLITACHHPHVVIKFDLRARTVTTLVELPVNNLQLHSLALAWISLAVDRWGAFGEKDQFAVAYWMQGSYRLFDEDGTPAGYYVGPEKSQASGFLETGSVAYTKLTSYPAFCVFGEDGSFWHGGTAGDGVYRQTLRKSTDPEINVALYKRGLELYTSGVPAPVYRRGWRGHSRLGELSFYDFADKSDAAIASWIATWPIKYTADDVAALTYFIRWQA